MTVTGDTQPDNGQRAEATQEPDSPSSLIRTWSASGITIADIAAEPCNFVRRLRGRYIVTACGLAILIAGVFVSFSANSPAFCCLGPLLGVVGAAGLCLCIFAYGSAARGARRAVRAASSDQIQTALAEHLPALPAEYLHGVLKHVARRLVDSGRLGCVLRIGPRKALGQVEPLAVPFEPHLLDSTDEESQSETEEGDTGRQEPRERGYVSALRESFRPIKKWLDRYAVWANLVIWITLGIVNSLRSGQIDFVIYALGMGILVSAIVRFRQRGLRELQPLIVPGALIVRDAGWRSADWRVTMFEPHETVFLTCRFPDGRWELLLSSQTQMYYFRVTEAQARAALRAWLSPLAPPTLEQLSDLR